jgi:hypothetical protein
MVNALLHPGTFTRDKAFDGSAYSLLTTSVASPSVSTTLNRQAIVLNGTSQLLQGTSGIVGAGEITISVWFNSAALDGTLRGLYNVGLTDAYRSACLATHNANSIYFTVYNGTGTDYDDYTVTLATALVTGRWYHVVATWSGSTHAMAVYLNGKAVSGSYATSGTKPTTILNHPQLVGRFPGSGRFWSGSIAALTVFSRVYNATDVAALYKEQLR